MLGRPYTHNLYSACVSMSCWSSAAKDVPRERSMTFSNGNIQQSGSVGHMTSNGTSAVTDNVTQNMRGVTLRSAVSQRNLSLCSSGLS